MKKGDAKEKSGFTIIEVILVLAIAGLIFLMIFIAWPALSRTQRDSRRRDDISIFLRKVKDYQTNNRGALPAISGDGKNITFPESVSTSQNTWADFYHDYLGEDFIEPNGGYYVIDVEQCKSGGKMGETCTGAITGAAPYPSNLLVFVAASCDGDQAVVSNNPRKIAVQYRLEGSGVYCANT